MVLWTYGLSQWAIHQSTMAMPYQSSTKIEAQTKQFEGIEMMGPRGLLKRISVMMKLEGLKMVTIGAIHDANGHVRASKKIGARELDLKQVQALTSWWNFYSGEPFVALHIAQDDEGGARIVIAVDHGDSIDVEDLKIWSTQTPILGAFAADRIAADDTITSVAAASRGIGL